MEWLEDYLKRVPEGCGTFRVHRRETVRYEPARMRRIAIIGSAGAGKSTLARQLGAILGLKVIHLDSLFWHPGWVETPRDEWIRVQEELVTEDAWVIDGNYRGTMDIRLAAADTIIFLDLPRRICLWRVVRRRFQYAGRARPDMAPGCVEQLDWEFLKWVWAFPSRERPDVLRKLAEYADGRQVIVLRRPADVARFLAEISRARASQPPAPPP